MGAVPRRGLTLGFPAISTPEDRYSRTPHQDDQFTRQQPGAGGPPYDPDLEPATQGDVKSVKRWLWVSLVWAVAASAIALIALLSDDTGDGDDEPVSSGGGASAGQVRQLDRRIEELEDRAENAPSGGDIEDLEGRIDELEGNVEELGDAPSEESITDINDRLDELEQRVEELENEEPPPAEP